MYKLTLKCPSCQSIILTWSKLTAEKIVSIHPLLEEMAKRKNRCPKVPFHFGMIFTIQDKDDKVVPYAQILEKVLSLSTITG